MKFAATHSKIRRAEERLAGLDGSIQAFLRSEYFKLDLEHDPVTGSNSLGVVVNALPVAVPLSIGETIYNLRSALDLLASEIVRTAGLASNDTYFPIRQTPADFTKALQKSQIERANPRIARVIRDEIRPFASGNPTLYAMNRLGNIDKHRLLIPSVVITQIRDFVAEDPVRRNKVTIGTLHLNSGGRFGIVRSDSPMRVTHHGAVTAEVLFGPETECSSEPIVPTLQKFIDATRDAVWKVEAA